MELQGLHTLFYLAAILFMTYTAIVLASGFMKKKILGIDGYGSFKLHAVILIVGALLIVFRPIKLTVESDASRTAVRHTFDIPVYESNRPEVEASNPSFTRDEMKAENEQSRKEWDQVHNNNSEVK